MPIELRDDERAPTREVLKDSSIAGRRSLFTPSQHSAPVGVGRQLIDVPAESDVTPEQIQKTYEKCVAEGYGDDVRKSDRPLLDVEKGLAVRRSVAGLRGGWEAVEYENGLTIAGDPTHPLFGLGVEKLEGKDV